MNQYRVGIIGATGMVGQRFISLLKDHAGLLTGRFPTMRRT